LPPEHLCHFKLDQTLYSIKPNDFDTLPLFVEGPGATIYLNEFFFYLLSMVPFWQGMKRVGVATVEEVQALGDNAGMYVAIPKTASGPAMEATPVISKAMAAYLVAFVGASPFPKKGDRHEGRIEKLYANAMVRLSNVSDKDFLKYIVRKMTAWYKRFPPDADRKNDTDDDDEQPADDSLVGEGEGLEMSEEDDA
jgi:hypothetical protein